MHIGDKQAIEALGKETGKPIPQVLDWEFDLFNNGYELDGAGRVCRLRLDGRGLRHMNPLKALTAMTVLDLTHNQIQEISGLENLTALTRLVLKNNQIQEIKGLETLAALIHLDLRDNQIQTTQGLETLTALKELDLRNNRIRKITGLENLTALTEIGLTNNNIQDISGLEKLTGLTTILLNKNGLDSLPRWLAELGPDWTLDSDLSQICVGDNPLELPPPRIIAQGMKAVRAYFDRLENHS